MQEMPEQEMTEQDRDALAAIIAEITTRVRERWQWSHRADIRPLMDEDDAEVIGSEVEITITFRSDRTAVVVPNGRPYLTTDESLALAVLVGDNPAFALADYLQEQGLIPKPRPSIGLKGYLQECDAGMPPDELADYLDRLVQFAYEQRLNLNGKKFQGKVRTAEAWEMVEGMIGDMRRELFGRPNA